VEVELLVLVLVFNYKVVVSIYTLLKDVHGTVLEVVLVDKDRDKMELNSTQWVAVVVLQPYYIVVVKLLQVLVVAVEKEVQDMIMVLVHLEKHVNHLSIVMDFLF
tara:strand:+ start:120 stop:434 length:315 start_codon:yes stop_codon:yes gene_type:complete